jgi:hypothetical protein
MVIVEAGCCAKGLALRSVHSNSEMKLSPNLATTKVGSFDLVFGEKLAT